jgi:hypothetical protein
MGSKYIINLNWKGECVMATQLIKTTIVFRRGTMDEWKKYNPVPAAGEPCFVLDENVLKIGDGVTAFEDLQPINGASIEIASDGKSIVLEDDVLKLMGFDAAEVGAQPRKNAEGNIEWIVPSDETVDGLQIVVSGLKSDVTNLQTNVTEIREIVMSSEEGSGTLLERVEALETKVDGEGEESVDAKINSKINEFANQISDDGTVNTLKELVDYVATHGKDVETLVNGVTTLQELVGSESVRNQINVAIAASNHIAKDEAKTTLERVKYEIVHKPAGTLVDCRDKEIRVMIPADTKFELQNSGENADPNAYYIGFKAYAPNDAVSFKEDLAEIITDNTMYFFEGNDFAGIDAYGRKYSIVWIPVSKHTDGTWVYYGASSSKNKYIGWHYSVEWYDENGKVIDSDCIRINLSNESCHGNIEPFYMNNFVKEVSVNGTLLDAINGKVDIVVPEVKSSNEITVNEDGTLSIKAINFDKIIQSEETVIIMDGGSAV